MCQYLSFSPTVPVDGRYDAGYYTVFGPVVAHTGKVYANCPENLSLAFTRLCVIRPGELIYRRNQVRLLRSKIGFFRQLRDILSRSITFSTMIDEMLAHYDDPHEKRALRIRAKEELEETGAIGKRLWFTRKARVTGKLKTMEVAKSGKVPRTIVDLAVPASMQGAWAVNNYKHAMVPIVYGNLTLFYCHGPTPKALEEVLTRLTAPTTTYTLVFFSDDSCLSIKGQDGVRVYNMDISKCDASHTGELFEALYESTPESMQETMRILIDQCRLPILITNPHNPSERVELEPKEPILFSGSTITTILNNTANMLIGLSIQHYAAKTQNGIITAAAEAGYIVTLEEAHILEDIQFLKHSPCQRIDGTYAMTLNYGVLVRALGNCKRDLPGRGDILKRARAFNAGLVRGAYPRVSTPVVDNLRRGEFSLEAEAEFKWKVQEGGVSGTFHTHEFLRRYALTPSEIDEVLKYSQGEVGEMYNSYGLRKILAKDYGLTTYC